MWQQGLCSSCRQPAAVAFGALRLSAARCSSLTPSLHTLRAPQQEAQAARAQTNGYQLDKAHKFVVTLFDEFARYGQVPDEYAQPDAKTFAAEARGGVGWGVCVVEGGGGGCCAAPQAGAPGGGRLGCSLGTPAPSSRPPPLPTTRRATCTAG